MKATVDATSGPNGENASGRLQIQLTKQGEPAANFKVDVDCMVVTDASGPSWTSSHAIVGGTIRNDKKGYGWGMFHVLTNADGSGVDWANVWVWDELQGGGNACQQDEGVTGFSILEKGGFSVTNS